MVDSLEYLAEYLVDWSVVLEAVVVVEGARNGDAIVVTDAIVDPFEDFE